MAEAKSLQLVLKLKDEASKKLGGASKSFKTFSNNAAKAGVAVGGLAIAIGTKSVKAFIAQERAETKLEQITRQTTQATDEQITALKAQATALQKVGIVGDEVTLVGQAQLATFGLQTESISALSEGMLDLAVNQFGTNVSQENLMGTANLLGKVMEGQVGALSRVGVSFTEAQEKILKTGTEMEKASTLAEVLSGNVGGLNEAMAKTTEGGLAQLQNNFGDITEQMGAALVPALTTVVEALSNFTTFLQENQDLVNKVVPVLGILALTLVSLKVGLIAVAIAQKAYTVGLGIAKIAQLAFNAAMLPTIITILAVVAVIAVLAGVIFLIAKNWDMIKEKTIQVWTSIKDFFIRTWEAIKNFFLENATLIMAGLAAIFTGGLSILVALVIDNWDAIKAATIAAWEAVKSFLSGAWQSIKDAALGAFNGLKDGITAVWDSIVGGITGAIDRIMGAIDRVKGAFNKVKSSIGGGLSKARSAIGFANGGVVQGFAKGGGVGRTDTVPALLTPGEVVLNASQQKNLAGQLTGGSQINITGNTFQGTSSEMADQMFNVLMSKLKANMII